MTDRLRDSLRSVVLAFLPEIANLGRWEYQVISVDPGPPVKITARAVSPTCPHPSPIADIVLWPGPSGGYAVPLPDSIVLLGFNDGDPTKPAIVGLDPSEFPLSIKLGGPTPLAAAYAPPLVTLFGALETFMGALTTYVNAIQGVADPTHAATPAMLSGITAAAGALAAAATATPALVTEIQ